MFLAANNPSQDFKRKKHGSDAKLRLSKYILLRKQERKQEVVEQTFMKCKEFVDLCYVLFCEHKNN